MGSSKLFERVKSLLDEANIILNDGSLDAKIAEIEVIKAYSTLNDAPGLWKIGEN